MVFIGLLLFGGAIWYVNQSSPLFSKLSQINQTLLPTLNPYIEKKFENADFNYVFNYPEVYAIKTASESATTTIQYCPDMQLTECDFQSNTITIQEFPNPDKMVLETWLDVSDDSPIGRDDDICWNNDLRSPQDAGKIQGFDFRSYQFKIDEQSLSGVCKDTALTDRGNMLYKFIRYGDKIIFIKIANASDAQFSNLLKIASSLTLLPLPNTSATWTPVCKSLNLTNLQAPVLENQVGTTYLARKAINDYFNSVTLSSLNSQIPRLNQQESIYAEDYIRKNVDFGTITVGQMVKIPCEVVEEATLRARLLTIDQKENLSKYNVTERQIDDIINQEMEKSFQNAPGLREHSGVIKVN